MTTANRKKMRATIADTNGVTITAEWRVPRESNDTHDDAAQIILGLYEKMGALEENPISTSITTTWLEERA
jgi:hypothetical protein